MATSRRRILMIDSGWVAAGTVFSYFGTRGSGDLRTGHTDLDVAAYVFAIVAPLALILVRRYPIPVFGLEAVLTAAYLGRDYPGGPIYLFLGAAALAMGWFVPRRLSGILAVTSAAVLVGAAALHPPSGSWLTVTPQLGSWTIVAIVPWLLGTLARANRTVTVQVSEQARRLEADEERVRIAREVHDVVGHSLAVISMQAGVALHVADRRPDQARVALEAIARSSRDALDDLRATLAVLRGDDAPHAPAPGIDDLPALIEGFRATGQQVKLIINTGCEHVPSAHALAAYRIVQESLTNTARHGAAAPAQVTLEHTGGALRLDVVDAGQVDVVAPPAGSAGGSGLAGMRERARALGGRLSAGPAPGGGWRVQAELPWPERRP